MILDAYINDRRCGRFEAQSNTYRFEYDEEWRTDPETFRVSWSMPKTRATHQGPAVQTYLQGLLPDNDNTLLAWSKRWGVNRRRPLELLRHVGQDCPGAIQFVHPDDESHKHARASVDWLTEQELCSRIEELINSRTDGRTEADTGQFSLPGAQAKTALRFDPDAGRWGIPTGSEPTTDILKPVMEDLEHQVWCEHFCLELAREVDLLAPSSRIERICGHDILIVSRYDRELVDGQWRRIHQEDVCQALGVPPENKYENATASRLGRGPGLPELMDLAANAAEATHARHFWFSAVLFNALIGGTDAHAKNFGLLWSAGDLWDPAPLYDLNSILPYTRPYGGRWDIQKIRLSMRMGKNYNLHTMQMHDLLAAARACQEREIYASSRMEQLAAAVIHGSESVAGKVAEAGCPSEFLERLHNSITASARQWLDRLVTQ